jgi:hypothetical protein
VSTLIICTIDVESAGAARSRLMANALRTARRKADFMEISWR